MQYLCELQSNILCPFMLQLFDKKVILDADKWANNFKIAMTKMKWSLCPYYLSVY